jgi:hypothetical protein
MGFMISTAAMAALLFDSAPVLEPCGECMAGMRECLELFLTFVRVAMPIATNADDRCLL